MITEDLKEILPLDWFCTRFTTNYKLVILRLDDSKHIILKNKLFDAFEDDDDEVDSVQIFKIVNPYAYGRFKLREQEMKSRYGYAQKRVLKNIYKIVK